MHLIKVGLFLTVILSISSIGIFAQKQPLADWNTFCIDGIKDGELIECPGFARGNGTFSITRYMTNPTGSLDATLPVKFVRATDDPKPPKFEYNSKLSIKGNQERWKEYYEKYRPHELEFVDYSPVRTNENQIWEFRGRLGSIGDESKKPAWLATLSFTCYRYVKTDNQSNPNERKKVLCQNGTYEGKMRVRNTKSGVIYTLFLAVVVDFPPPEKK